MAEESPHDLAVMRCAVIGLLRLKYEFRNVSSKTTCCTSGYRVGLTSTWIWLCGPAKVYDSFQEIRIFASARLAVEDKIKMLDFMKKFRENELGFSCGGFFVVSKGCPVKVYSSLYSAFNVLLQVRDILKGGDNKCISFVAHILNLSQNSTLLQK
ncbi:uncharacterized protein LOC111630988 [Centruroides sculpturatus]|uniref:uncharacterized protein LOC111630988 n=1 Tax=Centruroides sculpturatus TaxID=218467 RepID=UPI000C6E5BE0|nr:uncharacterized protein LOC111630988 [Centruroides sculpturatus]